MMASLYYWGTTANFLFYTSDESTYYWSLLWVFVLALAYEFMSVVRRYFSLDFRHLTEDDLKDSKFIWREAYWLLNSFTAVIQLILAYQLMLVIMSFNCGVSLTAFAGFFVGRYIFDRYYQSHNRTVLEVNCHE